MSHTPSQCMCGLALCDRAAWMGHYIHCQHLRRLRGVLEDAGARVGDKGGWEWLGITTHYLSVNVSALL